MKIMQRPIGFFITGTDTGVGKTWVTAGLARSLQTKGYRVAVWKPFQSGALIGSPDADSYFLKQWGDLKQDEQAIATYTFKEPVSPALAAEWNDVELDWDRLDQAHYRLASSCDIVLVEGAGGLAVPVSRHFTIADVAKRYSYPLLIVGRAGLGTVNHTILTVKYAQSLDLVIQGIVLNGFKPTQNDLSEQSNPEWIEQWTRIPVLARLPYISDSITPDEWMNIIQQQTQWDLLLK
jgi:dethiobiotin synthetase